MDAINDVLGAIDGFFAYPILELDKIARKVDKNGVLDTFLFEAHHTQSLT